MHQASDTGFDAPRTVPTVDTRTPSLWQTLRSTESDEWACLIKKSQYGDMWGCETEGPLLLVLVLVLVLVLALSESDGMLAPIAVQI